MIRYVFILSDGTGLTAESLGNSLLTQFENIEFKKHTIPYIDSSEKADKVVRQINECYAESGTLPLVFMTLVSPKIAEKIRQAQGKMFDLFNTFVAPLEEELGEKSSYTIGRTHGVADLQSYTDRIDALNYTLDHDDGINSRDYNKADIILVGVSRCGKTPSCLYMALRFGIWAANYPFTEDDLSYNTLPKLLKPFKNKLFGLTIDPHRLQHIRTARSPNTQYASAEQCRLEVTEIEAMYKRENIPFINSTRCSIEEIATKVIDESGIGRRLL